MNHLFEYARCAVLDGVILREAYERQVKRTGFITGKFLVGTPSDILLFLTTAALAGIVGNLSTELIKYLYRYIKIHLTEHKANLDKYSEQLLSDESFQEIFMYYLEEYHSNKFTGSEIVRKTIFRKIINPKVLEDPKINEELEIIAKNINCILKQWSNSQTTGFKENKNTASSSS